MANYPSINRKWQSHLLFISNFIFGMKHCMKNRPNNNDQVKREEECFVKTKSYSGIFMYCTNNQNFLLSKIRIRLLSTSHKST